MENTSYVNATDKFLFPCRSDETYLPAKLNEGIFEVDIYNQKINRIAQYSLHVYLQLMT